MKDVKHTLILILKICFLASQIILLTGPPGQGVVNAAICASSCATCTNTTTCSTCASGKYFKVGAKAEAGLCFAAVDGEFLDLSTGLIKPCDTSCATCNLI